MPLVKKYVFWWALFAVANSLSLNLQSFCRNDGFPGLVAFTNVIATAVNIFLDWLFVFPMHKGVMGAAVATGISQIVGLLIILTHLVFKKGSLVIRRYKPQIRLFRKIIFRGLPEAIAQFSTPVTTLCMNYTLMATFGNIGINAFSIISYLSSFTMAVFFGASEGRQPLFGQAYGAREDDNLKHYYRVGQIISIFGSAFCVAIYVIFRIFSASCSVRLTKRLVLRQAICGNTAGALSSEASIPCSPHISTLPKAPVRQSRSTSSAALL